MANSDIKYTYQDYLSIGHDDKRYEVLEGELLLTPSPNVKHQRISARLGDALRQFVEGQGRGLVFQAPLDVVLSPTDVVQPDVFYIAHNRIGIIGQQNIQGPPDLVIEILSPATSARDRKLKRVSYGRYGVKEFWIIDPEARTVEVLRHTEEDFDVVAVVPEGNRVTTPLLDGFALDVTTLFKDAVLF